MEQKFILYLYNTVTIDFSDIVGDVSSKFSYNLFDVDGAVKEQINKPVIAVISPLASRRSAATRSNSEV